MTPCRRFRRVGSPKVSPCPQPSKAILNAFLCRFNFFFPFKESWRPPPPQRMFLLSYRIPNGAFLVFSVSFAEPVAVHLRPLFLLDVPGFLLFVSSAVAADADFFRFSFFFLMIRRFDMGFLKVSFWMTLHNLLFFFFFPSRARILKFPGLDLFSSR